MPPHTYMGAIYQQHGLLTSEALHLPKKVSIIHCPGHQKGRDPISTGSGPTEGTSGADTGGARSRTDFGLD